MLEIFAICSCACLACLWCAVVLELTKEKCSRKRHNGVFGWNCPKCSKNHRCTDRKGQFSRKLYNNDCCSKDFEHREQKIHETRDRDEERSCRCCHCSERTLTSRHPPCSKSESFPRLRTNHCTITPSKRACKICRQAKHGCAYSRDNENPSSCKHLCVHRSSCPNLMSQGFYCTYQRPPVPCFYRPLFYDPCKQSIKANTWKDRRECYRQGRATSKRKRHIARVRKEQF